MDPALAFVLGFSSGVGLIALGEIGAWLIDRAKFQRLIEESTAERSAQFQGHVCPWPEDTKFPHRLAGTAAARKTRGDSAQAGSGIQVRHSSSSRLLPGGSESPL